jgi:hypothetical protein
LVSGSAFSEDLGWVDHQRCIKDLKDVKLQVNPSMTSDCKTKEDWNKVEAAKYQGSAPMANPVKAGSLDQKQAADESSGRDPNKFYCKVSGSGLFKLSEVADAQACDALSKNVFCKSGPQGERSSSYDVSFYKGDQVVNFNRHQASEAGCAAEPVVKIQKGICRYGSEALPGSYFTDQGGADKCAADVAAKFSRNSKEIGEQCTFNSDTVKNLSEMKFDAELAVNISGHSYRGHAAGIPCPKHHAATEALPSSILNPTGGANSR